MRYSRQSIEQQLAEAQITFVTLRSNPDLQVELTKYGYSAEHIAEGETLRSAANAAYQQQVTAYGNLRTAVDSLSETARQARTTYMRHVKSARIAFENQQGIVRILKLSGRRRVDLNGWIVQAQQFYSAALTDTVIQQGFAGVGVNKAALQQGAQQIENVVQELADRIHQKNIASERTTERNTVFYALRKWMHDFRLIARVALKDRPLILKQFGISARSVAS